MLTLPNYQIISPPIYQGGNSVVYRGIRVTDNQPVILKVLNKDYPTLEELRRYRQEYEITKSLNFEGVIQTYGIKRYQNTLIILLEDFGGESLKTLLSSFRHVSTDSTTASVVELVETKLVETELVETKLVETEEQGGMAVSDFLPLAIQIADSLAQIHASNVIHKDINPANIVWNKATNQLKIIDFGIASRLPRENPTPKNPEHLEGTLAYLSPEQTGRMNQSLDYHTDLYSLGVTFYELLTGQLPFDSTDTLALIHCHIAKTPKSVCEINSKVPQILSDIVMKLMAKNVKNRYQSAFGVKFDLEKCLENLRGFQNLKGLSFELAQNDFSGKLQIPQKLYGRANEVKILLQTFERIANSPQSPFVKGRGEMMLIAGYSGVGKTALVHEVRKSIISKNSYFASGKFEQYQRNIPYSALSQAFNEFCTYLLTESSERLNQWRDKILNAVGNNGQVLIDIIPQLEFIIGSQPAVAQVGSTEAQNRFNLFFQNFFRAICQKQHPLVLFIDDLQWADSASLNLLNTLMMDTENQDFLIIGAYRDNEVDMTHPLMIVIDKLQQAKALVNTISLANLSLNEVNTLIAEALTCKSSYVQPLAQLVYEKTRGNAFFTHEFLKSLYGQSLLVFVVQTQTWQWEAGKIATLNMTSNVVELMMSKISQLPAETIQMLKLAACIGNSFELKTLSLIGQQSPSDTLHHLWAAIEEGLLFSLEKNYKQPDSDDITTHFKFQHDSIQQAAYFLIADTDKLSLHLQIGRFLKANTTHLETRIFEIVDHLFLGIRLVDNQAEKNEIAKLALMAGQKAKAGTAYEPAVNYLKIGLNLLANTRWETEYELTLELYVTIVLMVRWFPA